jgi:hypothetical protein
MTEHTPEEPGHEPADDSANTEMFRAFVARDDGAERPRAVGAPFRILTLLAGLAVFAVIVVLLLR